MVALGGRAVCRERGTPVTPVSFGGVGLESSCSAGVSPLSACRPTVPAVCSASGLDGDRKSRLSLPVLSARPVRGVRVGVLSRNLQKALCGGIPCPFLEPLARSWSHFVGIYRQNLTRSLEN
jgi:hypothetical protein